MQVKNVNFSYGEHTVLNDVSFQIPIGEITTIMGANGCGKSTLLHLMSKNLIPDRGKILLDEKEIRDIKPKVFARQAAIVHQYNTASEDITVRKLVAYGRLPWQNICQNICGRNSEEDERMVDWALEVTGLKRYERLEVTRLSGGQRQRVWIAMALAQNTKLLFLDEPTTFLDIRYQIEILNLVRKLNKDYEITVVMVLHDINQALAYSSRVIGLKDGKVLVCGKPEEVITSGMIQELYGVELDVETIRGKKVVLTA